MSKEEAVLLPGRPEFREETPRKGSGIAIEISMPRRTNMPPHCTKGKAEAVENLCISVKIRDGATIFGAENA